MPLFGKKPDPISARAKALNAEIEALELQIRQLNRKIDHSKLHPRVRSTAVPQGATIMAEPPSAPIDPGARDPIFEQLDYQRTKAQAEGESTEAHYNDLGVRKYDLLGAVRRLQNTFSSAPAANPKLVSYLAAGSIKGLRPLRYEKRIARNRFIFLFVLFVLILWGVAAAFLV
jgi:hypothetical protein